MDELRCKMLGGSVNGACRALMPQHALWCTGLVPQLQTLAEMRASLAKGHAPVLDREERPKRLAQAHNAQVHPRGPEVRCVTGKAADMRVWPRKPLDVTAWHWRKDGASKEEIDANIFWKLLATQLALA